MSRWPPSRLQVTLGPHGVQLLRIGRRITRRGLVRDVRPLEVVDCAPAAGAPAWQPPLQALAEVLPRVVRSAGPATVVVSHHFVRYALVDPPGDLAEDELLAWARHAFERIHGKAAGDWDVRLDAGSEGPRLACAIDAALVAGLRAAFDAAGMPLRALQPHLMAALDDARAFWRQPDAWLAVAEPGHLFLGLRQQGQWVRVRGLRVQGDGSAAVPRLLEREALLAGLEVVPCDVHAGGIAAGVGALPEPWRLHALASAPLFGRAVTG